MPCGARSDPSPTSRVRPLRLHQRSDRSLGCQSGSTAAEWAGATTCDRLAPAGDLPTVATRWQQAVLQVRAIRPRTCAMWTIRTPAIQSIDDWRLADRPEGLSVVYRAP